jgi:Lrp/AsnC family transcriptional regulator, leucine-responsive regulatory protein
MIEIDKYDEAILKALQQDARLSMAELGRRVHLSQPAATERVRKLEASGVITGYHASVDHRLLGYGIRAIVRVARCDYKAMLKLIDRLPEVIQAHSITGSDSWNLDVIVRDVEHLEAVLWCFKELSDTTTTVVLQTPLEQAPIGPPRAVSEVQSKASVNLKLKRA